MEILTLKLQDTTSAELLKNIPTALDEFYFQSSCFPFVEKRKMTCLQNAQLIGLNDHSDI